MPSDVKAALNKTVTIKSLESSRRKRYARLKLALAVCRRNLATNEMAIIGAKQVAIDPNLTVRGSHLVGKFNKHWAARKKELEKKEQEILDKMEQLQKEGTLI